MITREAARPELRAAAAKAADVIVAGQDKVDLAAALGALADRGLSRVNCEGGPHLLAQVAAAGLLDELTLTVSPTLAGPGAGRIVAGPAFAADRMTLTQVLAEDGYLFCRYLTASGNPSRIRRDLPPGARPRPPPTAESFSGDLSVTLEHMESEGSVPDAHEVAAALRVAIGMLYRRLKQASPTTS